MTQSINDASAFYFAVKGYFPVDEKHPAAVGGVQTDYYAFMNADGEYYLQKSQISADGITTTHRFYKGAENYATIWANYDSLSYDLPSAIFK